MLKKHQFWACVAIFAMAMCMITGHNIVSGHKTKE